MMLLLDKLATAVDDAADEDDDAAAVLTVVMMAKGGNDAVDGYGWYKWRWCVGRTC